MDVMAWTVSEALRTAPQLVGISDRLGLDICCGGALTLTEAARSIGLMPEELRAALESALEAKHR
jgi:iron-sulfur cluster repair protein YtfE (RIC family)